jgi:hypothetical protein
MIIIIAELKTGIHQDDHKDCHTESKSQYIDQAESAVPQDVPPGGDKVVSEYGGVDR